jgi:hypothetical protein
VRCNKGYATIYSCHFFSPVPVFYSCLWFILFLFLFWSIWLASLAKKSGGCVEKVARTELKQHLNYGDLARCSPNRVPMRPQRIGPATGSSGD